VGIHDAHICLGRARQFPRFLTNLFATGTEAFRTQYKPKGLHRIVQKMYSLNYADREPIPFCPVFGPKCLCHNFAAFSQDATATGFVYPPRSSRSPRCSLCTAA